MVLAACQATGPAPSTTPTSPVTSPPASTTPPVPGAVRVRLTTTKLGAWPNSIALDRRTDRVYVVLGSGTFTVLDGTTMRVVTEVATPNASAVALDDRRGVVYVASNGGVIWTIDPRTNRVLRKSRFSSSVRYVSNLAVEPATGRLYVQTQPIGLWILDPSTFRPLATLPIYGRVAFDPSRSKAYVTKPGRVRVIDTATNRIVAVRPIGGAAVAVDPRKNTLYFAIEDVLRVADGAKMRRIATIRNGVLAIEIAIDPAAQRVYVIDQGARNNDSVDPDAGLVWVVNTRTNKLVQTLAVGISPGSFGSTGAAFDPRTGALYMIDMNAGTVSRLGLP